LETTQSEALITWIAVALLTRLVNHLICDSLPFPYTTAYMLAELRSGHISQCSPGLVTFSLGWWHRSYWSERHTNELPPTTDIQLSSSTQ
jgi:hypothetical protein